MYPIIASMNTENVVARSLRKQLVEQIWQEIEVGQLPPGSRLDERSLGERFGISRTPAREVLLELSAAGLVRFVPRRGAVVLSMSPQETASMVEVLVALEGEAAALAARRMSGADRDAFAGDYTERTRGITALPLENYAEINACFHDAIYLGCQNEFLTGEIKKLRVRLAPYLQGSFVERGRLRSSHDEHLAILSAISAADPEAARAAMRNHILNGGNLLADIFARSARLNSTTGGDGAQP
jgi:DNA-binding GntR family transcriptional regulator